MTPPTVSMPMDSGHTSSSRMSFTCAHSPTNMHSDALHWRCCEPNCLLSSLRHYSICLTSNRRAPVPGATATHWGHQECHRIFSAAGVLNTSDQTVQLWSFTHTCDHGTMDSFTACTLLMRRGQLAGPRVEVLARRVLYLCSLRYQYFSVSGLVGVILRTSSPPSPERMPPWTAAP